MPSGGAAGCYSSIVAKDRNGDGLQEIYLAGSMGLHRLVLPGETTPP